MILLVSRHFRHPKARRSIGVALAASLFAVPTARAISFGQIDTFQNGTTAGWQEGPSSPNPPTNVANGGPAGAGDHYLEDSSSGGFGGGSRMTMFNTSQWVGNYVSAGVNRVTMQMANFGSNTLNMRVAFRSGSGTLYGSSTAASLPPDGTWRSIDFDLTPSALTNIGGSDSVPQALASVTEFRIVSAVGGATFTGDAVQGTIGIDNITATSIPVPPPMITALMFVNDVARISFTTVAGKTYRVERKDSLLDAEWVALSNAANITGTGGIIQVSDPQPGVRNLARRFYRVVLLD